MTVDEGLTATNTGTFSDLGDDTVTISASIGTITQGAGIWSWSYPTTDGPDESQTVTITATDSDGAVSITTFDLTVNNVAPMIISLELPDVPIDINDPVFLVGTFTDPGADTHSALIDLGDGVEELYYVTSPLEHSHNYESAGVYTISLTIIDDDGGTDTITSTYFVVVYDSEGGFITGGGWIISPEGAYKADPTLTGKATFGFVSKYKKGQTTPTGNTEFQFKAGDLNFHSSSYDWLVVTGSEYAKYKGTGTINGEGEYKFMIWAGDGEDDTFRIKIWEEDDYGVETIIYDNGFDQVLGGGNIVIHNN